MAYGDKKSIATNTSMLLLMNIATMAFPMLTLPYLTRVLSNEVYGTIIYIKAVMSYIQVLVDFGFILSATKDIAEAKDDIKQINQITSNTILAKLFLCGVGFAILVVLMFTLPILRKAKLLTVLYFLVVVLSVFLLDFLFRGLELMHVTTMRYVLMKTISTLLTFVFVRSDADVTWIPGLEVLGSLAAIILVVASLRKFNVKIVPPSAKAAWRMLKESAVYFLSNMASTSFTALNTLLLGIMLTTTEVAYWGVTLQIVTAIQSFYTPLTNGIFTAMVVKREFRLLRKMLLIFMPLITVGCIASYFLAPFGLSVVGGEEYIAATPVFRSLIPILFFGFPATLFGWPALGAIGKAKQTSLTTVLSIIFQIIGLAILIVCKRFTVITVAWMRSLTEMFMCLLRIMFCYKYRLEFVDFHGRKK